MSDIAKHVGKTVTFHYQENGPYRARVVQYDPVTQMARLCFLKANGNGTFRTLHSDWLSNIQRAVTESIEAKPSRKKAKNKA